MTRYHPLLVALHWIVAIMIFMAIVIGGRGLANIDNADPQKLGALQGHMVFGLAIGVLMLIRLVTRMKTEHPPEADAGNALFNLGGKLAHFGIYLLVFAMVGSGIGISITAGLAPIVFGGSGEPLPADFSIFTPRVAHGIIAKLILALIAAHILAWTYHQFLLKDGLISRMWFGKRK